MITETWIKETDDINLTKEIPPMGYNIISHPHKTSKQGGGLALTYRNTIKLQDKTDNTRNYETMEHSNFNILFAGTKINLHLVYRIPSTSVLKFCEELTDILEDHIRLDTGRIVFTGDFNIHIDEPQDSDTVTFSYFLDSFNLVNHVKGPTHISGHTLDLMITEHDQPLIEGIATGHILSDHCFVDSILTVYHTKPPIKKIRYRKLKDIDSKKFNRDVMNKMIELLDPAMELSSLVTEYDKRLIGVLDKHAPLKEKKVKQSYSQPWFNEKIRMEIQLRRTKERQYKNNPNEYTLNAFYQQQ